jgi:GT2 family glycosyltransferase
MDLSIIIVSYKGYNRLRQCLDSLITFCGKSLSTEVVVVNNCPGEEEFQIIEKQYPGFLFVNNDINGGYANGCNKGSSHAKGKYLLILNPDTIVTEGAVEELVTIAKSNPAFMITSCRQVNEKGEESVSWGPFPQFSNLTGFLRAIFRTGYKSQIRLNESYPSHIFFPDWISGSVVLISKDDYLRLKGFDEDFWMYYEDVDLCKRANAIGGAVAFCNNVTIEHNHGGSTRINKVTAAVTKTEVQISKHLYFNKHKSGIQVFLIHFFIIINNLISFGLVAVAGFLFFFIPKLNLRVFIYIKLIRYYIGALLNGTWVSPRSVRYKNTDRSR